MKSEANNRIHVLDNATKQELTYLILESNTFGEVLNKLKIVSNKNTREQLKRRLEILEIDTSALDWSKKSHRSRAEKLGMSLGKARHTLVKQIIIQLLEKLQENKCYKCGMLMTSETWSIEHKKPWINDSVDLFWDMENIAFSHKACNKPHTIKNGSKDRRKIGPEGTSWCSSCKQFKTVNQFSKGDKWDGFNKSCKDCDKNSKSIRRGKSPKSKTAVVLDPKKEQIIDQLLEKYDFDSYDFSHLPGYGQPTNLEF